MSLTAAKRRRLEVVSLARRTTRALGGNPYRLVPLDPRRTLRLGRVLTAPEKPGHAAPTIEARGGTIAVASCCSEAVPPTAGYRIVKPWEASSTAAAIQSLISAQVVVWDNTWQLDGPLNAQLLVSAIMVVALGRAVLPRPRWQGPHPHQSASLFLYLPAGRREAATLALGGELVDKHPAVCAALRKVVEHGASSWKIVSAEAAGAVKLFTLSAVRDFLLRSRRVYRARAGLASTLIRRAG